MHADLLGLEANDDMSETPFSGDVSFNADTVESDAEEMVDGHLQPAQLSAGAFTTNHLMEVNLLKLLNDMNAPHTSFKDVMEWAQEANARGYQFQPQSFDR